jgi:acyl-CoA thioesterase I
MQLKEAPRGQRFRVPWRARRGAEVLILAAALLVGCGGEGARLAPLPPGAVVLAFGDSLTAGTGAAPGEDYPARLAALSGLAVINAGMPGETSAQARGRLPGLLAEHAPALVLLGSGANDVLRRLPLDAAAANLEAMIEASRAAGAQVLLIAAPMPKLPLRPAPFYGLVAERTRVPLLADALAEILADRRLKHDFVHPNAAGYARLARLVGERLRELGALPPA